MVKEMSYSFSVMLLVMMSIAFDGGRGNNTFNGRTKKQYKMEGYKHKNFIIG